MYIKLTNGSPTIYSIAQLHKDNPGTSFPGAPSEELLASYDVYPLAVLPPPEHNPLTHVLKPSAPYQIGDKWHQHYIPEALPANVVAERADAARATAYAKEADPLFFKAQRGEVTLQDWLSKVEEIKARYPKTVE